MPQALLWSLFVSGPVLDEHLSEIAGDLGVASRLLVTGGSGNGENGCRTSGSGFRIELVGVATGAALIGGADLSAVDVVGPVRIHVPTGIVASLGRSVCRPRLGLDSRGLQLTLSGLWILDGALQLQPAMFTPRFADQVVAPAAAGQPGWVAWPVLHSAQLIAHHALVADLVFALVQLALGFGLLFLRTVRPALIASVAWALGVWVIGEGLGGTIGGTASILTGAPGAALLYALVALTAWPGPSRQVQTATLPSIPAWFARAWATLWVALGLSALLPANRSAGRVADQLDSVAGSAPTWLARIDQVVAEAIRHTGWFGIALLVLAPAAVGLAGLATGRMRRVAAWTAIGLAVVAWVVGESFGQLASGIATDPNTGPLLVVAALALLGLD